MGTASLKDAAIASRITGGRCIGKRIRFFMSPSPQVPKPPSHKLGIIPQLCNAKLFFIARLKSVVTKLICVQAKARIFNDV